MKVRASVKKICMKCKVSSSPRRRSRNLRESQAPPAPGIREERQWHVLQVLICRRNKRLWVGLTAIYGIGQQRARSLAEKAKVDADEKNQGSHRRRSQSDSRGY